MIKKGNIIKHNFIILYKKRGKKLTFADTELEKKLSSQKSYFLKNVDIEKVLVFKNIFSCKENYKCFIGCLYKLKSYGDEVKDFCNKEILKMNDPNHICVVVISLDSALKKMKIIIHKCF